MTQDAGLTPRELSSISYDVYNSLDKGKLSEIQIKFSIS